MSEVVTIRYKNNEGATATLTISKDMLPLILYVLNSSNNPIHITFPTEKEAEEWLKSNDFKKLYSILSNDEET